MISKLSIKILLIFLVTCTIHAQQKDSIIVDYSFWGNDFYIAGKEYSRSDIKDTLKYNPLTYSLINSSSSDKTWGYITMSAGVILTGRTLYDTYHSYYRYNQSAASTAGSSYLYVAVLAIGLDLSAIILFSKSNKSFYKAIKKYNQNLTTTDQSCRYELNLNFDLNRVTLSFRF